MAKILIVDDEQSILLFLREVLKADGHVIALARDGSEAIRMMNARSFDLIISDLHMKQLSGIDVLKAAKIEDPNQEVLILTGHGSIHSAVQAMKMGAFDFLTKPIDIEELRHKARLALEHRALRDQIQQQQRKIHEHQQMIARDLNLAETVQRTLVPKSVENDRISVHVLHKPIIGVGGDYGDIYYDGLNTCYLTLVDVTGHGISAALIVNRVCSEIQKLVRERHSPREILFMLNNFIYDSFYGTGLFLTAFSCMIDLQKMHLNYAGGAHPSLLAWQTRENIFRRFDSQNPIIGFEKNKKNVFIEDTIPVHHNDKILLFTDGLVDIEDDSGKPIGIEGLKEIVTHIVNDSPDQIAKSIVKKINTYCKTPSLDDIYLIAAQVK